MELKIKGIFNPLFVFVSVLKFVLCLHAILCLFPFANRIDARLLDWIVYTGQKFEVVATPYG